MSESQAKYGKEKVEFEISDKELCELITEFITGLLRKATCDHVGNCMTMCQILKPYLGFLYNIPTLIINTQVKQGKRLVNHYYLLRTSDGVIIDPTASQFKFPNGEQMPKVFIGEKPSFYI